MRKITFALVVLIASVIHAAHAGPYDTDVEINRLKPTVPAILVSLLPDKTMVASKVKVGELTDGQPLLCFRDPDKQLVSCFEVNVKTGQVVFIQLPADETVI